MLKMHLSDEAATRALGARLARVIEPGLLVYLHGELGSGKTTLARGLLRGLGGLSQHGVGGNCGGSCSRLLSPDSSRSLLRGVGDTSVVDDINTPLHFDHAQFRVWIKGQRGKVRVLCGVE